MLTVLPDQAKSRQTVTYRDQHGRAWWTVLDARARTSGGEPQISPCVPFTPKFSAPLDVPQKYLRVPAGSLAELLIDYDAWIQDTHEAGRQHRQNFETAAFQLYGQAAGAAIQAPPPELVGLVGRGPIPVQFIQAARTGNRWVLGLPQTNGEPYPVPQWAAPLLGQLLDTPTPLAAADFVDEVFADEDTPVVGFDADTAADLDEQYDPTATGGHTEPVRRPHRRTAQRA